MPNAQRRSLGTANMPVTPRQPPNSINSVQLRRRDTAPGAGAAPDPRDSMPAQKSSFPAFAKPSPGANGKRTFAMRDAALADREQYDLAAAEGAANSAMSPAGYGDFEGGMSQGIRDRSIGELKNQTVLQANLQNQRDKLSLDYLTNDNSAKRDWARIALDNRDSIRSGNQQDRQLDLADLESQYGQSNKDREFGRQTGLDEYGMSQDTLANRVDAYKFGNLSAAQQAERTQQEQQAEALRIKNVGDNFRAQREAEAKMPLIESQILRNKAAAEASQATAAKAGAPQPKGAGYYEGILTKAGVLSANNKGEIAAPPFGFKDTVKVLQAEHPDWPDEQVALTAYEQSGGTPPDPETYATFENSMKLRQQQGQAAPSTRTQPNPANPEVDAEVQSLVEQGGRVVEQGGRKVLIMPNGEQYEI